MLLIENKTVYLKHTRDW